MRQFVVVEVGSHQALPGQRNGHTGGVAGNPTASPLLRYICGSAGAAGGIEDEVAGVGGHENTALYNFRVCLYYKNLVVSPNRIRPRRGKLGCVAFVRIENKCESIALGLNAPRLHQPIHTLSWRAISVSRMFVKRALKFVVIHSRFHRPGGF